MSNSHFYLQFVPLSSYSLPLLTKNKNKKSNPNICKSQGVNMDINKNMYLSFLFGFGKYNHNYDPFVSCKGQISRGKAPLDVLGRRHGFSELSNFYYDFSFVVAIGRLLCYGALP